jgi:hypothetical protein
MVGGAATIVCGGAMLGVGVGAGVGSAATAVGMRGKKNTILQSAKLLVSVREIFLNDEHDTVYSNTVFEKYVQNVKDVEQGIIELEHQASSASDKEKKELMGRIKEAKESVAAMKIAENSLRKFVSSFEEGDAQM